MRLWDAGLDYLTITFRAGHAQYAKVLLMVKSEMEKTCHDFGEIEPWAWNGYRGEKHGKLMYGEREDGLIVRCSGSRTRLVGQLFRENKIYGKTTRVDFQATAKTSEPVDSYLSEVRRRVESACSSENGRQARNSAGYKNRGRDCGMVIGSRSSQNYNRIYNKSLEQRGKVEPNLVRFENESKGKRAEQAWAMYMNSASPFYINLSIVKAEMELIGLDMNWIAGAEKVEFPSSYEPTTPAKQAQWLFVNVRPTVLKLVRLIGRDAVLELLGLD